MDKEFLGILQCPGCSGALKEKKEYSLNCEGCGKEYDVEEGIPVFMNKD